MGDEGAVHFIEPDEPMTVDERQRTAAVAFALQMRNIGDRDSDSVVTDAEKFRKFLAGE